MPTNQSSPWDGGKPRACSNTESPTCIAATKVPFSPTSQDLSKTKDETKSLPSTVGSFATPLRQTTAALTVMERGTRNNIHSPFTSVPDKSAAQRQQSNELQCPNVLLATGLKHACSLRETSINVSINHDRLKVQRKCSSTQASQSGDGVASVQGHDSLINKEPSVQQIPNVMLVAADSPSSPTVPRLCLNFCEHQGEAFGKEVLNVDVTKPEIKSVTRDSTRRISTVKTIAKFGQSKVTDLDNGLLVVACPALITATNNCKPQTAATQDVNKRDSENQSLQGRSQLTRHRISHLRNGPLPASPNTKAGAALGEPLALSDIGPDSVTSKISALHITPQELPVYATPASWLTPPTSATESHQSGPECVIQEGTLSDELENDISSDNDSEYLSINGESSPASLMYLFSIEEPMTLEAEDNHMERRALVPSLFPLLPPTLYFSTASEKVEMLPVEQRRLLKWKMSTVTPNVVKSTIARSHFKVTKKSHDWLGCWGHHMKSLCFKTIGEHQKLNHFPGTFQIGRKDRLWRNLSRMQVRFGKQEFNFFPRTFILPQDIKLLRKAWEDGGYRQKWIIKPPASARGIGIQVIHKWSQMPRKRPLLVQKYLHKPYLISGNKFDLRIYVYVTSYDPLRIYIFSDGLVRFASCKYSSSMKTLGNKFMHLTNYSVNKKNSEYQANSDDKACQGHKWALKALWQYLGSKGINTNLIWEKIKDIVIKTIIASEPYVNSLLKMHVRKPYSCHELFGFDIMLDDNLKPWILEVNISPSLHSNTALDVAIKGQMVRDLLNLAGFRIPQKWEVVTPCSSSSSPPSSASKDKTKPDISADEKVKRTFYLTQRYADQEFLSTVLQVLTPSDVYVLAETEDELSRRGEFERIFPSATSSRYLRFFECTRYLNILLDQWEQKYWNNRDKGISVLRHLCQQGVHLGTGDPAHMWSKCSYISKFEPLRQELNSPSRSRVVVSHQHQSDFGEEDDGSDREASVSSLPVTESPGSSVTSSASTSPLLSV